MRTALFALALVACGPKSSPNKATPAPDPVWIEVNPSTPGVCIPFVGEAEPDVVAVWTQSVGALEARDLAVAQSSIPEGASHPAYDTLGGIQAMLSGDPQQAAIALDGVLAAYPNDPCLLSSSATAQQLLGRVDEAEQRVAIALSVAPDDPEIALIYAFLAPLDKAAAAFPALEKGATERPERRAFAIALGIAAITQGDAASATGWLRQAYDSGEEAVALMLLQAYRAAKQPGEYLRFASELGMPLGDDGLLATADDPVASFHTLLGKKDGESLVATVRTDHGDLECVLFPEEAPITVGNFVGLATGTQPWTHPDGGSSAGPMYADMVFHRVIPEFMVQTGDPLADGTGGPGYRFPDELHATLRFDRPGRLAMANSGPDSNGSQFFVTEVPTPHLDGRHTIFGQCTPASVERVIAIARDESSARLEAIEFASMAEAPELPPEPEPAEADEGSDPTEGAP